MPVVVPPPPQGPEPSHASKNGGGAHTVPASQVAAASQGHDPEVSVERVLWCIQVVLYGAIILWLHRGSGARLVDEVLVDVAAAAWVFGGSIPLLVFLATCFQQHVEARPVRTARPLLYALASTLLSFTAARLLSGSPEDPSTLPLKILTALVVQTLVWALVVPRIVRTRYLIKPAHNRGRHPRLARTLLAAGAFYAAWLFALGCVVTMFVFLARHALGAPDTTVPIALSLSGAALLWLHSTVAVRLMFTVRHAYLGAIAAQTATEALT